MENQAQGSIEYLLLIAAAIIIVAVVIVVIIGGVTQGQNEGKQANVDNNTQMVKLNCLKDCNYYGACITGTSGCGVYGDICVVSPSATCLKK